MRRTSHASELDLDLQGGWQLVGDGHGIEVVYVAAGSGFMPAAVGDRWDYVSTQPGSAPMLSSDRIVAGVMRGALWVARVRSEVVGLPAALAERDLVIGAAGVLPDIGTMTTAVGPVYTLATGGLFLPSAPGPGMRWEYMQELESPLARMTITGVAEFVAVERVTVPAGSFVAMRIESEVHSRVHLRSPEGSAPLESRQGDMSHWVRGLGLVRSASVGAPEQRIKRLVSHAVGGAPPSLEE